MAFTGIIVPIPAGHGGLVGTRDQQEIAPDKLLIARNLSYEGLVLRKEGGAAKYNSSAISGTPSIIGGHDWWPTAGTQRMVVLTSAGDLLKDSGAGTFPVTLASGLTVTDVNPVFVEADKQNAAGNNRLFIFTGKNQVQVLTADGATTTNLATPPADWSGSNQPSFGLIHDGHLWAGGNANDPHRLYYSTTSAFQDFTGAGSGSFSIYPGEGERLVGAISFKGYIIVWKFPVGIYLVDTTNPSSANWRVERISRSVGGVSPNGAVQIDNDIIFWDSTLNLHLMSAVTEYGDISSSNLSRKFSVYSFIQDNMNLSAGAHIRGVYYAAKREAHFSMRGLGATTNNARFVVDFNREDMVRFRYSDRDVCSSLWLRQDADRVQRLTSGDNAGFVWNMDQTTRSKDGLGYPGAWQTPYIDLRWLDPKLATVRKHGRFLELVISNSGNWNLNVDVLWDGDAVQTVAFNMGVAGAALGTFVLGTSVLGGDQMLNKKRRIVGSGRRVSFAGSNSGAGEDFAVGHLLLHVDVGDERRGRDDE